MDQFEEIARRHRRELHVYCYRMLASFDEAEDAVQETFLRAWRGWPASETAAALGTSVAAANSALQRARATMQQHLPQRRSDWSAPAPTAQEVGLVARFIEAHERCDTEAAAMGTWRLLPVRANRMPAAASYLQRPGDTAYRAFKLDLMRIESGLIAEIITFDAKLFPAFGLEPVLNLERRSGSRQAASW